MKKKVLKGWVKKAILILLFIGLILGALDFENMTLFLISKVISIAIFIFLTTIILFNQDSFN